MSDDLDGGLVVQRWIHRWLTPNGSVVAELALADRGFLLRFPGEADFVVAPDGGRVESRPDPRTDPETVRHLLLDQVYPRLLAQRGELVAHASAVLLEGRAVVFLGATGAGKSTIAASFHTAGAPLLSDDAIRLAQAPGRVLAQPTYFSLRLWPDAVAELFAAEPAASAVSDRNPKRRLVLSDSASRRIEPAPLAAVFLLSAPERGRENEIVTARLPPRDACMAIIENSFQLDPTDRLRAAAILDAATDVARSVPLFRLSYPRAFDRLPDARAAIRTCVQALAPARATVGEEASRRD